MLSYNIPDYTKYFEHKNLEKIHGQPTIENIVKLLNASFIGSVETSAIHSLLKQQTADWTKPMFDMVPSEFDVVASELADINNTYDDNILHAKLGYKTIIGKCEMSVRSTTTTCGQHILYDKDLVKLWMVHC